MREVDLIVGRFADATVDQLADDEMAEFEQLMEAPDRELLAWITGEADVPPAYDTALLRGCAISAIAASAPHEGGAQSPSC
jgi:antitoxin CptB